LVLCDIACRHMLPVGVITTVPITECTTALLSFITLNKDMMTQLLTSITDFLFHQATAQPSLESSSAIQTVCPTPLGCLCV
jgi:hypothetical protein